MILSLKSNDRTACIGVHMSPPPISPSASSRPERKRSHAAEPQRGSSGDRQERKRRHSTLAHSAQRRSTSPERSSSRNSAGAAAAKEVGEAWQRRRQLVAAAEEKYFRENRKALLAAGRSTSEIRRWIRTVEVHVKKWIEDLEGTWLHLGEKEFEAATTHVRNCLRALMTDKTTLRRLRLHDVKERCAKLETRSIERAVRSLSDLPHSTELLRSLYGLENVQLQALMVLGVAAAAMGGTAAGTTAWLRKHPEWWPPGFSGPPGGGGPGRPGAGGPGDGGGDSPPPPPSGSKEADERDAMSARRESQGRKHQEEIARHAAQAAGVAQAARDEELEREREAGRREGRRGVQGQTNIWNNNAYWKQFLGAALTSYPSLSALAIALAGGYLVTRTVAGRDPAADRSSVPLSPVDIGASPAHIAASALLHEEDLIADPETI